jgi:hypothetical protein
MKILIETIPHREQRYPTVGDWQFRTIDRSANGLPPETQLLISVSEMSDWRYEALVAIHEAIEALACLHAGVTEAQIDQFDLNFDHLNVSGIVEPGDHPHAPYHYQHRFATIVEELLAMELGVDWQSYAKEVERL